MMRKLRKAVGLVIGISAVFTAGPGGAEVVRLSIESRTPMSVSYGKAGAYELLQGHVYGELDPKDPHNVIITDLQLAPRNSRGKVEYSATFALAKPLDMARASGVLFYDTPNRGFGSASGDEDGNIHLISGWQGDIAPVGRMQTAIVPVAHSPDGSPVTGPITVRFIDMLKGAPSLPIQAGLGPGALRPTPVSLDTHDASLLRRTSDYGLAETIPSADWAFADCTQTPFPGRPDPHAVCVRGGFDPAFAYELNYIGKDPPVLGVGFAAVRDLVSFLRYGAGGADTPNPVEGKVRWTIGTGVSQSGNFIRSFIRLGFNTSEQGRIVFDGVNPHIAARQVPLNVRFGTPGGAAGVYEPGSEGVLWWGRYNDKSRGRGVTSLLDRCTESHTCPKVMETFGSAEFWGLRLSADMVGVDAGADIPLPPNVRRYYFPGVTHGGGSGGFDLPEKASRVPGCALAANPNPETDTMRALTKALVRWVMSDTPPPPSVYPTIARGDLVAPNSRAMGFPKLLGGLAPDGKLNPFLIQDFGSGFHADDLSGVMTTEPPRIVREAPSLVPRVDADGNETSGLASVQHQVPLGTYLGWNIKAAGFDKGTGCGFQGGFIPFATTRTEREAMRDPRPSLQERYVDHDGFVERVRKAAAKLVAEGFLLPEDADQVVRQADSSNILHH